jgi:class 3 adenylate cyclase/ABC-type branched-subunit amino acid transport system substrate-binding protein
MRDGPPESITRGFLFADLRGYTDFVEKHGAVAAASLLSRYRDLARNAIGRFDGAEIKTEGDSFYVVFGSVSNAVRCGLALTADARAATAEHPDEPIRVGVGIHAGETVALDDGFVGSPVNIAARLCSQAGPNEVFVSETVRALTRTVLPVRFQAKGRRALKGIAEPIEVFAVAETADGAGAWADEPKARISRGRRFAIIGGALVAVAALVAVGAWALRPSGLPRGEWTIALDVPLTGVLAAEGVAIRNAVQLAIDEANESGALEGVELVLEPYDHAGDTGEGVPDPDRAAANATAMVNDDRTIAVIGPYNSGIAFSTIPITNEAGLLHCSPSATDPTLTKPEYGALELRASFPDRINFVRLAPADDNQIRGLAGFADQDLEAESALVIDDGTVDFDLWVNQFAESFTDLGGQVVRSTLGPGPDGVAAALTPLTSGGAVDVVFFGGFEPGSADEVRRGMIEAGHEAVPLLLTEAFLAPGSEEDSYLAEMGEAAAGSYASHSSIGPFRASFADAYRAAYGEEPNEYAAAAHGCAEVIIESLEALAETGMSAEGLREALRAHAVDPSHRFETVLGTVGFDANGDSIQQFVDLYRVDPAAADGAGDWALIRQQDFGPPPD